MEQSAVDKEHAEYCAKVDATPETVLCGHLDRIKADYDAYYIQCSDGTGDVCEGCIEKTQYKIIYLPDAEKSDNIKGLEFDEDDCAIHPYWKEGDKWATYVEWVFLGTVAELKALLKSLED